MKNSVVKTPNQRKKWILAFVLLFGGIVLCFMGKLLRDIHQENKIKLYFEIEQASDRPKDIIDYTMSRIKERWNPSDYCTINHELLFLKEQGVVRNIVIKLFDRDGTEYSINIWGDEQREGRVTATIYKMEHVSGGEKIWQQGMPVGKNEKFLEYLQSNDPFTRCCTIQYYPISKVLANAEHKISDAENIFLGHDAEDTYYLFHSVELSDQRTWDHNKLSILVPVQEVSP